MTHHRDNLYWVFFDSTKAGAGERYEGVRLSQGAETFSTPVPFEFTSLRAFKDAAAAREAIQKVPWNDRVVADGPKEEFGRSRSLNWKRNREFEERTNSSRHRRGYNGRQRRYEGWF